MGVYEVGHLIVQARQLARDYYQSTGKSLPGISAELARYDAASQLNLVLTEDPNCGYDALSREQPAQRLQIRGRVIFDPEKVNQRVGQLRLQKPWDGAVLVLMDPLFEATEMFIAVRQVIEEAAAETSAKRRAKGVLSVSKFRRLGRLVWSRETGRIDGSIWCPDGESSPERVGR
ncbi:MAG TPA: hypothetical protein ENI62_08360 [Gammaproteobacteria bacterium]|nr:hypothetical protein [Gammaproteobacteria bacterium]